jgi:hypothetical protein
MLASDYSLTESCCFRMCSRSWPRGRLSSLDLRSDSAGSILHAKTSDRRAIKIALAALLLLAPSPRSVRGNRPATKFLLSELPPLTLRGATRRNRGWIFWRCLHRCAATPVAAIGIVAMPVSGALGTG